MNSKLVTLYSDRVMYFFQIGYATEDEIMEKHSREHLELAKSSASMSKEEHMALCEKYDSVRFNKVC